MPKIKFLLMSAVFLPSMEFLSSEGICSQFYQRTQKDPNSIKLDQTTFSNVKRAVNENLKICRDRYASQNPGREHWSTASDREESISNLKLLISLSKDGKDYSKIRDLYINAIQQNAIQQRTLTEDLYKNKLLSLVIGLYIYEALFQAVNHHDRRSKATLDELYKTTHNKVMSSLNQKGTGITKRVADLVRQCRKKGNGDRDDNSIIENYFNYSFTKWLTDFWVICDKCDEGSSIKSVISKVFKVDSVESRCDKKKSTPLKREVRHEDQRFNRKIDQIKIGNKQSSTNHNNLNVTLQKSNNNNRINVINTNGLTKNNPPNTKDNLRTNKNVSSNNDFSLFNNQNNSLNYDSEADGFNLIKDDSNDDNNSRFLDNSKNKNNNLNKKKVENDRLRKESYSNNLRLNKYDQKPRNLFTQKEVIENKNQALKENANIEKISKNIFKDRESGLLTYSDSPEDRITKDETDVINAYNKIVENPTRPHGGIENFHNNSCYAIAVVQALTFFPDFQKDLMESFLKNYSDLRKKVDSSKTNEEEKKQANVVIEFMKLLSGLWNTQKLSLNGYQVVNPKSFMLALHAYNNKSFDVNDSKGHDAKVLWESLAKAIHSQLKIKSQIDLENFSGKDNGARKFAQKNYEQKDSVISKTFGIGTKTRTSRICDSNNEITLARDPIKFVEHIGVKEALEYARNNQNRPKSQPSLDLIPTFIQNGFAYKFNNDTERPEGCYCNKHGRDEKYYIMDTIEVLPEVVSLAIDYNDSTNSAAVDIPEVIDLSPFIVQGFINMADTKYYLAAVVAYVGETDAKSTGHFITFGRPSIESSWVKYDTKTVRSDRAAGDQIRKYDLRGLGVNSYIVFYKRVDVRSYNKKRFEYENYCNQNNVNRGNFSNNILNQQILSKNNAFPNLNINYGNSYFNIPNNVNNPQYNPQFLWGNNGFTNQQRTSMYMWYMWQISQLNNANIRNNGFIQNNIWKNPNFKVFPSQFSPFNAQSGNQQNGYQNLTNNKNTNYNNFNNRQNVYQGANNNSVDSKKSEVNAPGNEPNEEDVVKKELERLKVKPFVVPGINDYKNKDYKNKSNVYTTRGIANIGATCFMNSVLQCLININNMAIYFLGKGNKLKNLLNNEDLKAGKEPNLSCLFGDLVQNLWRPTDEKLDFSPNDFRDTVEGMNPLFKEGQAGDSKDFIIWVLEQLHKELRKPIKSSLVSLDLPRLNQYDEQSALEYFFRGFTEETSVISDNFFLVSETTNECRYCKQFFTSRNLPNPICHNFQIANCLIFPLEEVRQWKLQQRLRFGQSSGNTVTLTDCFNYNQKTELFTGNNQNYCNICKQLCDSNYTNKIFSGPNILIIILNRGKNNIYNVGMNFPQEINLKQFFAKESGDDNYRLVGVVTHIGQSGPSAHFVASTYDAITNTWVRHNDSLTNKITDFTGEIHNFGTPYILFYQKKGLLKTGGIKSIQKK